MKVEMTELGPVKRALKIEVPEEAVNDEFQKVYAELKRQVRVPGFRPGKAPIALLEKRYAQAVEQDVAQRLVPNYYQRAIREAGVTPVVVDIPPLERMKVKRNAVFTFTATVEIKPNFQLGDYRPPNPISLKKDARTVTEDQIDKAVQTLREQHAQIEAAPEGSVVTDGMHIVLTMEGFLDGEPLEGTKKVSHLHKVGSNTPILGVTIDDHLLGKQVGDRLDIPQPFPANHPDTQLAGKTAVFTLHLEALKQQCLPDVDDEFAKDCGDYDTLDHLRTSIRNRLEDYLARDIEEGYKEQITERLLQMHHFDIPQPLIDRELQTLVQQRMLRDYPHRHDAGDLDEPVRLQEEAKRLQQELQPEATRRVKLGLVLEAIVEKEGLVVGPDEVEAEMQKMATAVKMSLEEVRKMVEAGGENARQDFKDRILADKALQAVYHYAVIQG